MEKLKRNQFLSGIKIDLETAKTLDILSILVPKFVRNSLAKGYSFNIFDQNFKISIGNFNMAEELENVTILFCDIYNFDSIITHENEKIVQILDQIYRHFDALCLTHGLQKIEVSSYSII